MSTRPAIDGTDPVLPKIGELVAGKYRLERVIGRGGMGLVCAALHEQLQELVALKFLRPDVVGAKDVVARFLREARASAKLRGEHVGRVIDVGTLDGGVPYLAMELLAGEDLSKQLRQQSRLESQEAVRFVLQACEALAEAHRLGIVHRDIKPANLFVSARPDGTPSIKLVDFGISKAPVGGATESGVTTEDSSLMGSPSYMSPEQMVTASDVDPRADIWSLGIVLYELLSGQRPFRGDSTPQVCMAVLNETPRPIHELVDGLPVALGDAVMRCLQKERGERFANVADLAEALAPFAPEDERVASLRARRILTAAEPTLLKSIPSETLPAEAAAKTSTTLGGAASVKLRSKVPRANRWSWVAVGGAVALVVVVGVLVWVRDRAPETTTPPIAGAEPDESPSRPAAPSAGRGEPEPEPLVSRPAGEAPAASSSSPAAPEAPPAVPPPKAAGLAGGSPKPSPPAPPPVADPAPPKSLVIPEDRK